MTNTQNNIFENNHSIDLLNLTMVTPDSNSTNAPNSSVSFVSESTSYKSKRTDCENIMCCIPSDSVISLFTCFVFNNKRFCYLWLCGNENRARG